MRLVVTVKYIFIRRSGKIGIYITLLSFLFCLVTNAQKYKLSFDSISLSDALLKASEQFDFKVAFDAQKASTVILNKEVTGNSNAEFIQNLLLNSGFTCQYKHGRFLIVKEIETSDDEWFIESQLTGSITDKETGEHLPFATVAIQDQKLYTSASSNGLFCIKGLQAKPVHLTINYIGYYPIDTVITWKKPFPDYDFKLSRKFQMIDSIVVKEAKVEMVDLRNEVDFATTINSSKLIDLPVLAETDIFKALQLLPGISYTENSSELSIRGGSSDQNLILFDGQTLYNLSHYFGVISSINPNVVKDVQVYKGGYDSRYGERVSGIVDITGKSGNQKKPTIYGDLNLVSGNLATEIPLGKKFNLVAACRRSYSDIYSTGFAGNLFEKNTPPIKGDSSNTVITTTPSFYFYDYNVKLTYRLSNKENFAVNAFGGKDLFNNTYSGPYNAWTINNVDKETWQNYGMSVAWLKQWNGSLYSNVQVGTSGYSNDHSNPIIIDGSHDPNKDPKYLPFQFNSFDTYNQNELTDISVAIRNTCYLNGNNQLNFGILTRRNTIYYHKDVSRSYVYDNINQAAWVSSVYAQDRIFLFQNLTLKPGLRISYYNGNNSWHIEPRFAANYKFSDKFSIRLATGRYCQFISQVLAQQESGYNRNFWVMANDTIPALTSSHYIFGSTLEAGNFLLDIEGYYKNFSGLQEYLFTSQFLRNSNRDPNKQGQPPALRSYFAIGTGKSYGIDCFVKYQIRHFTSWLSYSLSKSIRQFSLINYNSEMPAPTDQTHQSSWTNMLSVGKWNLSTISLFSTGRPYIWRTENINNMPAIRYYKRLPNYFRCDLAVNYNFKIGKIRLKTGATIINIFNRQNYYDINSRQFDFEHTSFTETTLIRSQELSLNLFIHFTL